MSRTPPCKSRARDRAGRDTAPMYICTVLSRPPETRDSRACHVSATAQTADSRKRGAEQPNHARAPPPEKAVPPATRRTLFGGPDGDRAKPTTARSRPLSRLCSANSAVPQPSISTTRPPTRRTLRAEFGQRPLLTRLDRRCPSSAYELVSSVVPAAHPSPRPLRAVPRVTRATCATCRRTPHHTRCHRPTPKCRHPGQPLERRPSSRQRHRNTRASRARS